MKNNGVIVFFVAFSLGSGAVQAAEATRYVRDWIAVPVYEAPTSESAAVMPGISSGTALTLLEDAERNGFQRVRMANGAEGWIASRYLIDEPTGRMQLERANGELAELRKSTEELRAQLANIPQDQRAGAQQMAQLKSDNERLHNDLQLLQQAPDNATRLALENIDLKKNNESLRAQLGAHSAELDELRRRRNYALFREGGIAVLAGALLTLLIANLWPKKKSEWF